MATRQYIGARYVTKIFENPSDPSSAEWVSGYAYEPLTMVTYQNSSYLSKKSVPASVGNPATNPLYWAVTGAYNGQIATLQSQIDAIKNTLKVTPEAYGAVGDGITDDTIAIQTAINENHTVYFSNKTYKITDNITIPSDRQLVGNHTIIYSDVIPNLSDNTNLVYAFNVNGNNVVIDGFVFIDVFTGIRSISSDNLVIKNIELSTRRFAIELNNVSHFEVSNIYIEQEQHTVTNVYYHTDGIHVYGNSHDGIIQNVSGTTCDDMIILHTGESTDYGSKGNIKNIVIENIYTVTENRLKNYSILYPNATYGIIKLLSYTTDYIIENITIDNVKGKSWHESAIIISTPGTNANHSKGLTISNCNVEKIDSNHNIGSTINVTGMYDDIRIVNSTIAISDASNMGAIGFNSIESNSILIDKCKLISKTTNNNYAFFVDLLTCTNFKISNSIIDNFLGYCMGYSSQHSQTFDIENYVINNCDISLRASDSAYNNHTLGIFACDTSFHGRYNIISNINFKSDAFMMHLGNSTDIEKIIVSNINVDSDYSKYLIFISNSGGTNYAAIVSNINANVVPIVLYSASTIRLVTHGALFNTAPTSFESNGQAGDVVECSNGVFYHDGTHFVKLT